MSDAIELFPARISGRVVKAREMPSKGAGSMAGGYNPTNDTAIIPASDTAFARTVRLHESAHAIWSRKSELRPNDFVGQAIEDARIHQLLKTEGSVRRDELYTALNGIHTVSRYMSSDKGENARVLEGLELIRAASILSKPNSSKIGLDNLAKTCAKYHPQGVELVDSIIESIKDGDIESARALTSKFFTGKLAEESEESKGEGDSSESEGESEDSQESNDSQESKGENESKGESKGKGESKESKEESKGESKEESKGESKDSKSEGKSESKDASKSTSPMEYETPAKRTFKASKEESIPESITGGDKSEFVPSSIKKAETIHQLEEARKDEEDGTITVITGDDGTIKLTEGEGRDKFTIPYPNMYVHTLSPNASRKVKGKGRNDYKSASQGIKIRTNRLALNSLSPSGGRLFETKHLGGTVLIDASGSMRIDDHKLYDIAENIPAGKVAYYSGTHDTFNGDAEDAKNPVWLENYWSGDLVIYANGGRIRKDRGDKLPKRHGGNLVDLAAITWLLKQPAPRYLVFDMGFTGTATLMEQARKLLEGAIKSKRIIRVTNLRELKELIGKK